MAASGGHWKSGNFVAAGSERKARTRLNLTPEDTEMLSALHEGSFLGGGAGSMLGPGPGSKDYSDALFARRYKSLIDRGLVTGRSFGAGDRTWRYTITPKGIRASQLARTIRGY